MAYLWDINTGYATRGGMYKTEREIAFIKKYMSDRKMNILDIGGGVAGLQCHYGKVVIV